MFPISIAGSIRISAPDGIGVAGLDGAHVRPLGVEVAPGLDAAHVLVALVRAGDQALEVPERLVRDDGHARVDRADEPGHRAELRPDLLLLRRTEVLAERVSQLDVVQAVVAARQDEHRAALVGDHRERLDQRARRHAEHLRDGLDRGRPGRVHDLRAGFPTGRRHAERWRSRPRRSPRSPMPTARRRSRPPGTAPCTRAPPARPSSRRRTRPGTTRARTGRRCGRRPGCAGRSRAAGRPRRGRTCTSPS